MNKLLALLAAGAFALSTGAIAQTPAAAPAAAPAKPAAAAAAGVRLPEVAASAMPVAPAATGAASTAGQSAGRFCLPFPHKGSPNAGAREISRIPSTAA